MWKVLSGIFMGWTLGANDSANIFGTGVAAGTIKYGTAILLTAIFVLVGSVFEGSKCISTLNELSPLLPLTAFCCTLATALTMTVLTYLGIPASASQGIVGAIIGASIWFGSPDFSGLYKIVTCWVFTPVCAVIFSYWLYRLVTYVLDRTITSITHRNLLYTFGIAIAGCYAAYCLGSNNVANVTGVYVGSGLLSSEAAALVGGLSIAGGVLTYSGRVMTTIGKGIAPLSPCSACVCVLATGLTLHVFTQIGVPVSSSQAVVGTVVGVGIVGGMRTVSGKMLARIATGWILTPFAAGVFSLILTKLIV